MRPSLLALAFVAIILAPLALAARTGFPPRAPLDEIASGAGMLAFAILLVSFTLSGRLRPITDRTGMDTTMRAHQLVAITALAAALIHPFLYVSDRSAPLPWDVTRAETVATDIGVLWSGMLAWLLLPTLVLLALTRGAPSYRYEVWRVTHGLGAVAIAGLVLDHALRAGRYASDSVLATFWIALFAAALAIFLWAWLVVPAAQIFRPWRVQSVCNVAEGAWDVVVAPEGHRGIRYRAGQFVWLNVGHSPFARNDNPFSIASAPASGRTLRFLVKEAGDFTGRIGALPPGTRAHVDGPHGTLTLEETDAPGIALIAGGIGLAPLIGILRQLHLTGDTRPRCLVYAEDRAEEIAHREELEAFAEAGEAEIVLVLEAPSPGWTGARGRIDAALLAGLFDRPDRRDWVYLLCGPPAMLEAVEDALIAMGVPSRRILSERFDYD